MGELCPPKLRSRALVGAADAQLAPERVFLTPNADGIFDRVNEL